MNIQITSRHMDNNPQVKEYLEKKILNLKKYFDGILDE